MLLSDYFVQCRRTHTRCKWGFLFHCGFFHIIKQIHVFFTPFFFLSFILSHFSRDPQALNLRFSASMFDPGYCSLGSETLSVSLRKKVIQA